MSIFRPQQFKNIFDSPPDKFFNYIHTEEGFNAMKEWYQTLAVSWNSAMPESSFLDGLRQITFLQISSLSSIFDILDYNSTGSVSFQEFFLILAGWAAVESNQLIHYIALYEDLLVPLSLMIDQDIVLRYHTTAYLLRLRKENFNKAFKIVFGNDLPIIFSRVHYRYLYYLMHTFTNDTEPTEAFPFSSKKTNSTRNSLSLDDLLSPLNSPKEVSSTTDRISEVSEKVVPDVARTECTCQLL
ncbi:hypothetical protein PCE1_001887 [Barthelona sp. PCE]